MQVPYYYYLYIPLLLMNRIFSFVSHYLTYQVLELREQHGTPLTVPLSSVLMELEGRITGE